MVALFVMAHHDDEFAVAPLMVSFRRAPADLAFVYLTDGAPIAQTRETETLRFLRDFGVPSANVHFAGRLQTIANGHLHDNIEKAWREILTSVGRLPPIDTVVALAWEGGHQDHDTAHFLATRLCRTLGLAPETFQFGLYHGKGLAGPLFKAWDPLSENGPRHKVDISLAGWLRCMLGVRHYPSQWRSWIGLFPAMVLTYLVQGGVFFQRFAADRVQQRPHPGPLLYERRYGIPYEVVRARLDAALLD